MKKTYITKKLIFQKTLNTMPQQNLSCREHIEIEKILCTKEIYYEKSIKICKAFASN
jgi:hypothetical protein